MLTVLFRLSTQSVYVFPNIRFLYLRVALIAIFLSLAKWHCLCLMKSPEGFLFLLVCFFVFLHKFSSHFFRIVIVGQHFENTLLTSTYKFDLNFSIDLPSCFLACLFSRGLHGNNTWCVLWESGRVLIFASLLTCFPVFLLVYLCLPKLRQKKW